MKTYFIYNGTEQSGPYSLADLSEMPLKRTFLVWRDGLEDWILISDLPELSNVLKSIPPEMKPQEHSDTEEMTSPQINTDYSLLYVQNIKNKQKNIAKIGLALLIVVGCFLVYNFVADPLIEEYRANQREKERKEFLRDNFNNYIDSKITYSYRRIGGISDVIITVKNKMEYSIDNISFIVNYLKSNGEVYDSEVVNSGRIAPNAIVYVYAPDKSRGTKVEFMMIDKKASSIDL